MCVTLFHDWPPKNRTGQALGTRSRQLIPLFQGWLFMGQTWIGESGGGSCGPSSMAGLCPLFMTGLPRAFQAGECASPSAPAGLPRVCHVLGSQHGKAVPPHPWLAYAVLDRPWEDRPWMLHSSLSQLDFLRTNRPWGSQSVKCVPWHS